MALSEDAILETHSLVKDFNGFLAVDGVSVRVKQGEIHALIGPNGAGKTTFFNLLTKFLQPTSGTIFYRGKNITREKPADIARRGVVRSFQICAVFPHLTVLENVRVALQRNLGTSFYFWRSEKSLSEPRSARHGAACRSSLGGIGAHSGIGSAVWAQARTGAGHDIGARAGLDAAR